MSPRAARRSPLLVLFLVVVGAVLAAGCLPADARRSPSRPYDSGAFSSLPPTPSPAPTGPHGPASFVPPTPTPAPTFFVYVVARGDSLNTIAHKYKTTARSIAFWNRETYPSLNPEAANYRPDLLQVGWTLFLIPDDVFNEEDLPGSSQDAEEPIEPEPTDEPEEPEESLPDG
jgi:hypothetical protein